MNPAILADAASCFVKLGIPFSQFSACMGRQFDIADDAVWHPLFADIIAAKYSGLLTLLPPDTFFKETVDAKTLRGGVGRARYGLADADFKD